MPRPGGDRSPTGSLRDGVEAELARRDATYHLQRVVESARREYRWAWRVLARATLSLVLSLQIELRCGNAARRYFAAGRGERVYGTPESEAVQERRQTRLASLTQAQLQSETQDAFAYYQALSDVEESSVDYRRTIRDSVPPADRLEAEGLDLRFTGGYW